MYFLRLGIISTLLSDALVSGFTTAAAVHVFVSQIKDLLGLKLKKRNDIFKVILTFYDIFANIHEVNIAAAIISAITIIVIIFNNEVLKPRAAKLCRFPIPIEMIVVVLGTILSIYTDLENNYSITTVGKIPVGLPHPILPSMELLSNIILDSFVITMISYTISMSMALIFAQKCNYEVDSNQELFAQVHII
uniref:SLC26A/SulP transporter domain-containing protein n=1 Tax=Trichogramma kaykai TaxID=54128 RepID=A0ABD2W8X9_9HYME